jgi:hypothetical protein
MQTPVHPRPGAPGTGSRRRALAGGLALLAAVATLALPMAPAAAAPEAGQYVQVAPTTVVNNVSVPAGGITSLRVTGANGIPAPAEVSAVAVNVVANQPSGAGWLQAYPEGDRPVDSPSTSPRAAPPPTSRSSLSRPTAASRSSPPPPPR